MNRNPPQGWRESKAFLDVSVNSGVLEWFFWVQNHLAQQLLQFSDCLPTHLCFPVLSEDSSEMSWVSFFGFSQPYALSTEKPTEANGFVMTADLIQSSGTSFFGFCGEQCSRPSKVLPVQTPAAPRTCFYKQNYSSEPSQPSSNDAYFR